MEWKNGNGQKWTKMEWTKKGKWYHNGRIGIKGGRDAMLHRSKIRFDQRFQAKMLNVGLTCLILCCVELYMLVDWLFVWILLSDKHYYDMEYLSAYLTTSYKF